MVLPGKVVMHKAFGEGRIVQQDASYVHVEFSSGTSGSSEIKLFVFPDAFEKFLKLDDQSADDYVQKFVQEKKAKREKEYNRLQKMQGIQTKHRWRFVERDRSISRRGAKKVIPRSQSVFWCKSDELDSVFTEWSVFTGAVKSGQKQGEPKRLARVGANSAVLLTFRGSDRAEKERQILGLFMVTPNFKPQKCLDGYIPGHPEYRIRLSEQEAEEMLFWNYYVDEKHPRRMTWNTGRHRYLDNEWMAQILRDIVSLKKDEIGRAQAKRFYDYFCQMNGIDMEKLPEPTGALMSGR